MMKGSRVAHPRIQRTLATAGMTAVLFALPLAGAGWAVGLDDPAGVLPPTVVEAVDDAVAPLEEAAQPQAPVVAQVVEAVVKAAPAPLREAAAKIAPAAPPGGPAGQSPLPAPAVPAAPVSPAAPVKDAAAAPVSAPAAAPDSGYARARQALLTQPMTTTPFPALDALLGAEQPLTADEARGASRTSDPRAAGSPWLVAVATAMLVLLGAAHIVYADGRLSRTTA